MDHIELGHGKISYKIKHHHDISVDKKQSSYYIQNSFKS